jgi:hypothetical protein
MENERMNDLTPQQTFENNVKERLRKDIGELIPDDVLSALVKTAIQETFFTKKKDGYKTEESWFETEVKNLLRPKLEVTITDYLKDNKDAIGKQVATTIVQNAPQLLGDFLMRVLTTNSSNISYGILDEFRKTVGRGY